MKDKLQIDDHFRSKNIYNKNTRQVNYREMLNRAREKSQEQTVVQDQSSDDEIENKFVKSNEKLKISNLTISNNINNIEIKSHLKPNYESNNSYNKKIQNNLNKNKPKFEEDDEQLISILNSSNINFSQLNKKKCDLKQSTIDAKADFYNDNLFDLIDEIEGRDKNKITSNFNFSKNNNEININLQVEKE